MSKELEALQRIVIFLKANHVMSKCGYENDVKIIENAIKQKDKYKEAMYVFEKDARALEIIREKEVDVGWLKRAKDLEQYNNGVGIGGFSALSQEEYELLKEVLL